MNNKSTAHKMASNSMWNAVENFSQLGIQMICTFVLARFLTPSDFGLIGMLVIFTQIAKTITDSGFGTALIRAKEVTQQDYSSIFYLNLILGVALYLILFCCSPLIAAFYHQPIFNTMCKVTFLVIPVFALQVVHRAIMVRNLQFKEQGLLSIAAALLSSIIAIILAYQWRNVWALVVQNLLMGILTTFFYWIFAKWHPSWIFSSFSIKKYLSFSKNLLFTGLVGSFFNNINALLIGRFYTSADLGFYNQANRINLIASGQTTNIIKNVSYPILSQVNNDGGDLRQGYKKVIVITILFVGCIMALLMGIAQDLLEILMGGEEWRRSGQYLMILGFAGMLHPLHSINENILRVVGDSKSILRLEIIRRCIMLVILAITVHFNVIVFVFGYAFYSFVLLFLNMSVCGRPIHYSLREQLFDVFPILCRQLLLVFIAFFINYILSDCNIFIRIVIVFSASSLICFMLFKNHEAFKTVIQLLKELIFRK